MGLQALREQRAAKAKELHDMLDANPGAWGEDLQATYDAGLDEIDRIDAQIKRVTDLNERAAKAALDSNLIEAGNRLERDDKSPTAGLFAKWLRGGDNALSAEEWQAIRATMSTGTGSEGGYTVQTDVAQVIVDALKEFGGVRASGATILVQEAGNPLDFPTSDGTSETGELLAENAEAADADITFGVKSVPTYKYSSKTVAVPIELLQDSKVDIEAFVRGRLVTRVGRITNTHFTTGTGSSQPQGVVTASGQGKVGTTGQTATVIYNDLIDLQHSVDPAYRRNARFMLHDKSLAIIRKIKDDDNRPIFIPGNSAGMNVGAPDTLLGDPLVINQDMAQMAANAKSILYGDFSPYIIRDVLALSLFRFTDSAFAKKGQVGFLMLSRHGGAFTDVGNSLKHYANSAS